MRPRRLVFLVALTATACALALVAAAGSETDASRTSVPALKTDPADRPAPQASRQGPPAGAGFLAFTQTPRRPGNLMERTGVAGRSVKGRPIVVRQLGDPGIRGRLLVFDCIHGNECAATGRIAPLANGCPDPAADIYIVPNLNPDGFARDTRVNGRGVDLNRNFPAAWRPIGQPGDPEYAGLQPFSEPESRLAARIIRRLRPEVTVWFHQDAARRPFVRAWGQSVPPARRFARLAHLPFRLMAWLPGTAPNWQNHRFHGAASFVVELPPGRPGGALRFRLSAAIDRVAREVGKD